MLKQPKGLIAAALANTGERFGFYTVMAILTLFLMSKFGIDGEQAGKIYSFFYTSIYILALVGGLIADRLRRVELIEQYKTEVVPFEKARTETVKARILDNLSKLAVDVDRNRLEQEMIFYLEKLDITEEKVRLTNHCNYFREVASSEEGAGRKLGFIAQEMGREINTMGSKANEPNIQILVVKMKDELEKIKEQVLNIL